MSPVDIEPSEEVQTARTVGVDRERGHSLNGQAVRRCGYERATRKAWPARHSPGQERSNIPLYAEGNIPHAPRAIFHMRQRSVLLGQKTLHFHPKARLRETQRALLTVPNACSDRQMLSIISKGIFMLEQVGKVAAD